MNKSYAVASANGHEEAMGNVGANARLVKLVNTPALGRRSYVGSSPTLARAGPSIQTGEGTGDAGGHCRFKSYTWHQIILR